DRERCLAPQERNTNEPTVEQAIALDRYQPPIAHCAKDFEGGQLVAPHGDHSRTNRARGVVEKPLEALLFAFERGDGDGYFEKVAKQPGCDLPVPEVRGEEDAALFFSRDTANVLDALVRATECRGAATRKDRSIDDPLSEVEE